MSRYTGAGSQRNGPRPPNRPARSSNREDGPNPRGPRSPSRFSSTNQRRSLNRDDPAQYTNQRAPTEHRNTDFYPPATMFTGYGQPSAPQSNAYGQPMYQPGYPPSGLPGYQFNPYQARHNAYGQGNYAPQYTYQGTGVQQQIPSWLNQLPPHRDAHRYGEASNTDMFLDRDRRRDEQDRDRSRSPGRRPTRGNRRKDWPGRNSSPKATETPRTVVDSKVMSLSNWCTKCHTATHTSSKCTAAARVTNHRFKCPDFGLKDITCTNEEFASVQSQHPATIEMLAHHIFHASDRLNFYEAFVETRDRIIQRIKDQSAPCHPQVDFKVHPLAAIKGITPFEAYAYRACRITHTLIKTCTDGLSNLYRATIATVIEAPKYANPNQKAGFSDHYKHAATVLKPLFQGPERPSAFEPVSEQQITYYVDVVKVAYQKYRDSMDDLYAAWLRLAKDHPMWKNPLKDGTEVYNDLPFHQFRVEVELNEPGCSSVQQPLALPTVIYPTLKNLPEYVSERTKMIKVEQGIIDILPANPEQLDGQDRPPRNAFAHDSHFQIKMCEIMAKMSATPDALQNATHGQNNHASQIQERLIEQDRTLHSHRGRVPLGGAEVIAQLLLAFYGDQNQTATNVTDQNPYPDLDTAEAVSLLGAGNDHDLIDLKDDKSIKKE